MRDHGTIKNRDFTSHMNSEGTVFMTFQTEQTFREMAIIFGEIFQQYITSSFFETSLVLEIFLYKISWYWPSAAVLD